MRNYLAIVPIALVLLLGACAQPPATPQPAASAATPLQAGTTPADSTSAATPEAKASPVSTDTPAPTATPQPSDTPTPVPTPTLTPTLANPPTTAPTPTFTAANDSGGSKKGCTPYVDCVPTPAPPSIALDKTENILLLGSDLRPGDNRWRTDTMLLLAIDHENNRVGVLSFPRDYWLHIPGYTSEWGASYDRINQVDFIGERLIKHPEGGFGLLKEVFMQDFGIRLDRYARLHRQGLVEIVDALGGVDVNLDCDLWELSPTEGKPGFVVAGEPFYVLHLPAGPNHLDGETALEFTTYRYNSTDWDRARRQQAFLMAVRQQFIRPDTLTQIPKLWLIFKDYFKTNLGLRDLIGLATLAANMDMQSIHAKVIDGSALQPVELKSKAAVSTSKGNSVHQVIEGLFDAPSITTQTKPSQGCFRPKWADVWMKKNPAAAAATPAAAAPAATTEAAPQATSATTATPEAAAAPEASVTPEATVAPS